MTKKLVALSFATSLLLTASSMAQAWQWTCNAVRGNGAQNWVWTSDSRNYSWNKVHDMCESSGALRCHIWCHRGTAAQNIPSEGESIHHS